MQSLQDLETETPCIQHPFAIPLKTAENPVVKFIALMPRHWRLDSPHVGSYRCWSCRAAIDISLLWSLGRGRRPFRSALRNSSGSAWLSFSLYQPVPFLHMAKWFSKAFPQSLQGNA